MNEAAPIALPRRPAVDATVAAGGVAGALLRVAIDRVFPVHGGSWPWATFGANLSGTLVLGLVVVLVRSRPNAWPYWRPLLATGFCGALTTFSALQLETLQLLRHDHVLLAFSYLLASTALGGVAIAPVLRGRR